MLFLLKPFVKWAGGKRQLLGEIKKHLPHDIVNRVYYEPFIGAGALFFELGPKKAVINDLNKDLILCYRVIKNHAEELINALRHHQEQNSKEYYYEVRKRDREKSYVTSNNIEKAARLIYLNKTCYNGLYRVNSQGYFNVPLGKYSNPLICEDSLIRALSNYLNSAEITILDTDFEKAVASSDTLSFIYFDPPYHSARKTGFKSYNENGFNDEEQIRLRDVMIRLTEKGIPCLLSNSDTLLIRELYKKKIFRINNISARRAINSDQNGRGKVNEVLVVNEPLMKLQ